MSASASAGRIRKVTATEPNGGTSGTGERARRAAVGNRLVAASSAPADARLSAARTQEQSRSLARQDRPTGGAARLRPDHGGRDEHAVSNIAPVPDCHSSDGIII